MWHQCKYVDDRPTCVSFGKFKISNGHTSATGHPIHFMFGSTLEFSGSTDRYFRFDQIQDAAGRQFEQEILANAKVSGRQQCVYEGPVTKKSTTNQRKEHVSYNSVTIFISLAVVASQICEIPRNSSKNRTFSSSGSSKIPKSSILLSIESAYATSY